MKKYKLINPILEVDLANPSYHESINNIVLNFVYWTRENLSASSKIFINLRDFLIAMEDYLERVSGLISSISTLAHKPFGLLFEDPTGKYLGDELADMTKKLRQMMNLHEWNRGHLFAHIHEKWGLADSIQLESLINGADGIWASLTNIGAAYGHASSTITLMNLIRLGNEKVMERYNGKALRHAANRVQEITTGKPAPEMQAVFGSKVLDAVFDWNGIAGGYVKGEMDLAEFFDEPPNIRISTTAGKNLLKVEYTF